MASSNSGLTSGRMSAVVTLIVMALIAVLAVPAIYRSRTAARRTQSKNNLKQLAMGVHNYHDTFGRLPPGSRATDEGVVCHGWFTTLLPFLASSPLYSQIDKELPWDHPLNRYNFLGSYHGHNILGVEPWFTSEGYGTQHYLANSNAMHRESRVRFEDMTEGISSFWLLGEARPQFAPWGYPFNWREMAYPLGQDNGFGGPWGGTNFAMADGAVRFIDDDVAQSIVDAARNQPPIAKAQAKARPAKSFAEGNEPEVTVCQADPQDDTSVYFAVLHAQEGLAEIAYRVISKGESRRVLSTRDIEESVATYQTLREVFARGLILNADTLRVLTRLEEEVEVLRVSVIELNDQAASQLSAFSSLRVLAGSASEETRKRIREALPECELHLD